MRSGQSDLPKTFKNHAKGLKNMFLRFRPKTDGTSISLTLSIMYNYGIKNTYSSTLVLDATKDSMFSDRTRADLSEVSLPKRQ